MTRPNEDRGFYEIRKLATRTAPPLALFAFNMISVFSTFLCDYLFIPFDDRTSIYYSWTVSISLFVFAQSSCHLREIIKRAEPDCYSLAAFLSNAMI